jgi:hypothetical protein
VAAVVAVDGAVAAPAHDHVAEVPVGNVAVDAVMEWHGAVCLVLDKQIV